MLLTCRMSKNTVFKVIVSYHSHHVNMDTLSIIQVHNLNLSGGEGGKEGGGEEHFILEVGMQVKEAMELFQASGASFQ